MVNRQDDFTAIALAHLHRGEWREAEHLFRTAIAANAADAAAHAGLGVLAHQIGNYMAAIELFDRSLAIDNSVAATFVNRGNSLSALNRFDEAIASHQTALQLSPELISARVNQASALQALGRIDEAVLLLESASALQSSSAEALNNLANLYKEQGRLHESIRCYDGALRINPMFQQAASNRLAALKLDSTLSPSDLLVEHRKWSAWFEAVSGSAPILKNAPNADRRLRIGYVSPDCHGALPAFINPVIAAHRREWFDVYCYFNNPQLNELLVAMGISATYRNILGRTDEEVSKKIHDDQIDILIDVAGHTGKNRLGVYARRVAPVQLTWLDYLGTTGLRGMDYRLTDHVADPVGAEQFHSEKLLRMPHTQWCWKPDQNAPGVTALPALRNGHITFGSFNNAIKLTDATLSLWRRLLVAIPDARLRIAGIAPGIASDRIVQSLRVDSHRLDILPRVNAFEYRASIGSVDIALDPMPFSGATTTLDALWRGVPVLTLPGASSCSRSSASLLTAMGLEAWIALDAEDWLKRGRRLADDLTGLSKVRIGLRDQMRASPVLDVGRFVSDLEHIFRGAWRKWCAERSPLDEELFAMRQRLHRCVQTESTDIAELDTVTDALIKVIRVRPNWIQAQTDVSQALLSWAQSHPDAKTAWQLSSPPKQKRTCVSVIVCSIRPDYFLHVRSRIEQTFAGHDVQIVGIHDAVSLSEGYNRGALLARGDVLIFCHDDIDFVHEDFGNRVLAHLQTYDLIGVAGTSMLVSGDWSHAGLPHVHGQIVHRIANEPALLAEEMNGYLYMGIGLQRPLVTDVQALDGVFMATRRNTWQALRFDQDTFDGFHLYDVDFSYRAALAGYKCVIPMDLLLAHFSIGRFDLAWQKYNVKFLRKFPALANLPNVSRFSNLNVKLRTLQQIERFHAGLLAHQFGLIDESAMTNDRQTMNPCS